jgi:hypothetical protein
MKGGTAAAILGAHIAPMATLRPPLAGRSRVLTDFALQGLGGSENLLVESELTR